VKIFTTNVTLNMEVHVWKLSGFEVQMQTPNPDQIGLGGGLRSSSALVSAAVKTPVTAAK